MIFALALIKWFSQEREQEKEKEKTEEAREFHPSREEAGLSEWGVAGAEDGRRSERANVRYWNDEMTKEKIGPNWQDSQEARQTPDSAGKRREQRRWDGEKIE